MVQHTVQAVSAGELSAQQLANIAYGAARSVRDKWLRILFAAVAMAAQRRMRDFNPQNLANTAWAFATAGQKEALLFAALTTAVQRRMGDFKPQGLANTAWTFATAGQKNASLFAALAIAAKPCLGDFDAQELGNTAWAFAKACLPDE